jgi:hypothetical protein
MSVSLGLKNNFKKALTFWGSFLGRNGMKSMILKTAEIKFNYGNTDAKKKLYSVAT